MKKCLILFITLITTAILMGEVSSKPGAVKSTKQWRVGYYQGGEYVDYQMNFLGILQGLKELDWIEYDEIPESIRNGEVKDMWAWLGKSVKSDYLVFAQDAFWDANWEQDTREKLREEILRRLGDEERKLDLMFAAGTWAGLDIVNDRHDTPTIVFSTSDPVQSGIIPSYDSNRYDHTFVVCFPYRFRAQLQIFHEIVGFHRLGVVYEDTETGRSYASLATIHEMAQEYDFEVIEEHCVQDRPDKEQTLKDLIACHKRLAPRIDAMYLTEFETMEPKNMEILLHPFFEYKIPTFSQSGIEEVPYGVLMSLGSEDPVYVGRFVAKTIGRILNGATPGKQENRFNSPPRLSINMETARRIGFDVPMDVLEMSDNVYNEIIRAGSRKDNE